MKTFSDGEVLKRYYRFAWYRFMKAKGFSVLLASLRVSIAYRAMIDNR